MTGALATVAASANVDVQVWQVVLLAGLALAVGFLGGLMGLVLGSLRLPFIVLVGFPATTAAGINIAVSALSSLSGSYRHLRDRRVDYRMVALMGVPSVVGAFAGGFLAGSLPEGLLLLIISLVVGYSGIDMLKRLKRRRHQVFNKKSAVVEEQPPPRNTRGWLLVPGAIGLVIGLLGGAVGLVLGTMRLPALIQVLRLSPHKAVGTNLTIGFGLGVFGFTGHLLQRQVDYTVLGFMGAAAVVGSYLGARQTGRTHPDVLRLLIGIVLCGVSIEMLRQAILAL